MIKFIISNKEWLFSGIGVVILLSIIAFIRKILFRKSYKKGEEKKPQEITIHLNPSCESSKSGESNLVPFERISPLSYQQIEKAITEAPPLQRDNIKESFKGIKVAWDCYLRGASKVDNDTVSLRMWISNAPKEGPLCTIWCKVSLKDYGELNILPEGTKIRIQGEIAKADRFDIELVNVKLLFLENQ